MEFRRDIEHRSVESVKAFAILQNKFIEFRETCAGMQLRGVSSNSNPTVLSDDPCVFEMTFLNITLTFHLVPISNNEGKLRARVFVERKRPIFSINPEIIGSFDFNEKGTTVLSDAEGVDIVVGGDHIALNYFDLAISSPPAIT